MVSTCRISYFRTKQEEGNTTEYNAPRHLVLLQQGERPLCARAVKLDGEVGDVPSHGRHPNAEDVLESSVVVIVSLRARGWRHGTGQVETRRFKLLHAKFFVGTKDDMLRYRWCISSSRYRAQAGWKQSQGLSCLGEDRMWTTLLSLRG